VTASQAREHAAEFGLGGTILLDPRHALARAVGASITPEAAVLLANGALAYRGRIDDQYQDLGVKRGVVTRRDLRAALTAIHAGRPVKNPRTAAVGCLLPEPKAAGCCCDRR
jgi:hypothetical protein